MKRASVVLYLIAICMLSFVVLRDGLQLLQTQDINYGAAPAAAFGQSLKISLEAHGMGKEGGRVSVMINGKAVTTFAAGNVTLLVKDQDILEIDSDLSNKIYVKVRETAPEVLLPRAGDNVQVQNSIETLGRVLIRKRNG